MNTDFYGYDENLLESLEELGCAGDSECGTFVKFGLEWAEGKIARAHFWSREIGTNTFAASVASQLAKLCKGMTVYEAARLGRTSTNCDDTALASEMVAEDAFHHALGVYVMQAMRKRETVPTRDNSILVAMSGGVDSAVCLFKSADRANSDILGCTLRLWIDPKSPDPDRACCAPDSVRRARHTCHEAGYGHLSLDMRHAFQEHIVKPFIEDYKAGETPNPCVSCNGNFRLHELVYCANALGFDRIATGHYAQTVDRDGLIFVKRGIDPKKDQSYMLSRVPQEIISRFWFPLGGQTKVESRKQAADLGLVQAKIKGSQEVCFLGGGDYRSFLERHNGLGKSGNIVDRAGNILNTHTGIAQFTLGQRKGLGGNVQLRGSNGEPIPAYVTELDPSTGTVTVGSRDELRCHTISLRSVNVIGNSLPDHILIQPRYRVRGGAARAKIVSNTDNKIVATIDAGLDVVSPGQVAVLYDGNDTVIATGIVAR